MSWSDISVQNKGRNVPVKPRIRAMIAILIDKQEKIEAENSGFLEITFHPKKVYVKLASFVGLEKDDDGFNGGNGA